MNNPIWFDVDYYMNEKLISVGPSYTIETVWDAFRNAGFSNPYDHYKACGNAELLNPNKLFSATDYLTNKANSLGLNEAYVFKAITDAGMTLAEHYDSFGYKEGINPSNDFDQGKYLQAKLYQVQGINPSATITDIIDAFDSNGFTPLEHYLMFAKTEGLTEADANARGYSYAVADSRPVVNPNKDKGFTYSMDYSKNTVNTIDIERIVTQMEEDGTTTYRIETTTVDITRIEEVTNVTIIGSVTMDLSDVFDILGY